MDEFRGAGKDVNKMVPSADTKHKELCKFQIHDLINMLNTRK
jgi:hypothetical protein